MMHAPLAPSSAARIVACPGSVTLSAQHPDEDSVDTINGEAAHWGLAELLRGSDIDVGLVAANNVTLDLPMVEGAQMFADHIKARGPVGDVETMIINDMIHPLNWGTPDHVGFGPMTLYIDDFKYGHGYVGAFMNWQLINYAALKLRELMGRHGDKVWEYKVVLTICQPRSYHRDGPIRSWAIPARELHPHFETLRRQYALAMTHEAPCVVSPECRNCSGRFPCEANAAGAAEAEGVAYQSIPLNISNDAAARELRRLETAKAVLDSRITGLDQQITSNIKRGARVTGYVLDTGSGKTVWNKPQHEVIMLGEVLGAEFSKPDTITPIQAAAALKRLGIDPAIIAAYSETLPGAPRLVRIEDSAAAKAFSK